MVELARALAQHPAVYRVELMTRLIQDPAVDASYGQPSEVLWRPPGEDDSGLGGAHLTRLPCGPSDTYLRCTLSPFCVRTSPASVSRHRHGRGNRISRAWTNPAPIWGTHEVASGACTRSL